MKTTTKRDKKYEIFAITRSDIDYAIKQCRTQMKALAENDEEYESNRKEFNRMKRLMKENPKYHYDAIVARVLEAFGEIDYKFQGRFNVVVEEYMTNGNRGQPKDAGMDM